MANLPALAIRFDVDTHRCLLEGVPRLLLLAREEQVKFTFFVNMGRAVSHAAFLRRRAAARSGQPATPRLGARPKLGFVGYWTAALLNPRVGDGAPEILRRAIDEGHEVGLHGGTNHAKWQEAADGWSREELRRELAYGMERFEAATGRTPNGFASPGWVTPASLPTLLAEAGFSYLADEHGPDAPLRWADEDRRLVAVPTLLTGEPDGVAYLEWAARAGSTRPPSCPTSSAPWTLRPRWSSRTTTPTTPASTRSRLCEP